MIAVNDHCQEYTLAEPSAVSVSNPYVLESLPQHFIVSQRGDLIGH